MTPFEIGGIALLVLAVTFALSLLYADRKQGPTMVRRAEPSHTETKTASSLRTYYFELSQVFEKMARAEEESPAQEAKKNPPFSPANPSPSNSWHTLGFFWQMNLLLPSSSYPSSTSSVAF